MGVVAVFLLLGLISIRAPDIVPARFWGEDLNIFLADALSGGLETILKPYAGYLHLMPRLAAWLAAATSLAWAPWIYLTMVLILTVWSASVLFRTMGGGIAGVAASTSLLLGSGWVEPIGSMTNVQWLMAPALLTLALNSSALTKREGAAFAVISGLTGPSPRYS